MSPSAKLVVPLEKLIQERSENAEQAEKEGRKRVRNNRENTKVGGGGAPGAGANIHHSLWRAHGGIGFPERNCNPWRARSRAEERCEEEGEAKSNYYVLPIIPHPHLPP